MTSYVFLVRLLGELFHLHGVRFSVHHPGLRIFQVGSLPQEGLHQLRSCHVPDRHDRIHSFHSILADIVSNLCVFV